MACFCAYSLEIYMKAQKHACFHVFSPFSVHLYPPLHHNGTPDKECIGGGGVEFESPFCSPTEDYSGHAEIRSL